MDFSKCDEVSCIRVMNSFCCARLICIKRHAISIPQFLLRSGNRANASMGLFYITSNETQVLFLVDITEHICNKADIEQKKKIGLTITEGSIVLCNSTHAHTHTQKKAARFIRNWICLLSNPAWVRGIAPCQQYISPPWSL